MRHLEAGQAMGKIIITIWPHRLQDRDERMAQVRLPCSRQCSRQESNLPAGPSVSGVSFVNKGAQPVGERQECASIIARVIGTS